MFTVLCFITMYLAAVSFGNFKGSDFNDNFIALVLEISKVCSLLYVHIIEAIVTERIVTVGGRYEKKNHLADGHCTPASTVI